MHYVLTSIWFSSGQALLFEIFDWISTTGFAGLIQFWQDPKFGRPRTFSGKNLAFQFDIPNCLLKVTL